jgi:hypothetical protein
LALGLLAAFFTAVYRGCDKRDAQERIEGVSTFFASVFALDVFFVVAALATGFFVIDLVTFVVAGAFFTTGFLDVVAEGFLVRGLEFYKGIRNKTAKSHNDNLPPWLRSTWI